MEVQEFGDIKMIMKTMTTNRRTGITLVMRLKVAQLKTHLNLLMEIRPASQR